MLVDGAQTSWAQSHDRSYVFASLLDSQALSFVFAAVVICAFSAWLLVRLIEQVEMTTPNARRWWLLGTAVVAGIGVWTTHFVAMLGYRTDLILNYQLGMTVISAIAAIIVVGVPFSLSIICTKTWIRFVTGATAGGGIGVMHISGMAALEGCGQTQSLGFNIFACLIGATCIGVACALPRRGNWPFVTGGLIVVAVCGTHFISIAGTVLTGTRVDGLLTGIQVALSVLTATGTAILLLGTFLALTAAKRFKTQETLHRRVLATALQNMSNGILTVSAAEVIELYNERLCTMLKLAPGDVARGMSLTAFLDQTGRANGWDDDRVARVLRNHQTWMAGNDETRIEHLFDDGRILSIVCQPVEGGAVLTFDDVTLAKQAQQEISQLAYRDPLTGLANRRSLTEHMAQVYAAEQSFTLLLIDLDRFKAVNDTYGHGVGDSLLVSVAARIQEMVGEIGFVARHGGDEMAIVTHVGVEASSMLAEYIVAEIEKPYSFDNLTVVIGCSIGVCGTEDKSSPADLMQRADIALYEAKRHGRGRAARYTPGMIEAIAERRSLETDIRTALAENQFYLAYQPIMTLIDNRIVGYEALIRWHHPTRGLVPPDTFIPLAEETGLIVPVGCWVLKEACHQAMAWASNHHIAVNVSAAQFRSPKLLAHITSALAKSGLPAHRLEIELTETALVEDGPQIAHTLAALRQLGVKVAMDDFGTGYSSFAHLRDLPLDRIKIDRSFVATALTDKHSMAVVRAITQMGRDMGIPTLAEGVEEVEQLSFLRELGCEAVQGYLIGRPDRTVSPQSLTWITRAA
ncbi:EAL domain-containing protein [Methylobacterium sp. E-045]|uniref:EAL domain-containing protein n=1 Tax=Methylobacterium sp. E-045 TaxID=2836575 RepID=UPI001FBA223F|nr:EAL domain-containing protein [Methylobacterium sp. E-045]MCJ2132379.1 EAL domain-containing protein [Methylobacterium sp. E-045]